MNPAIWPAVRRVLTSRYFFIPVGAVLFYTLMGFVFIPLVVSWYVPKYARDSLKCEAAFAKVRMNPFLLTFEARGFELKQADGAPLVSFDRFFADMEIRSLAHWAAIFRDLRLEKPVVHATIEPDGVLNLQALVPKAQEVKEPEKPDSKPFRMLLENIAVLGGKVVLTDRRQSNPAQFTVEMFDLSLKDLSTLQDYDGTYLFTTTTPEGEKFDWQGEISLSPFRSSGKISISGLKTATLWEFFRDAVNLEQPGGSLDVNAQYRFDASGSPALFVLEGFHLDLSDLSLQMINSPKAFLEWKQLEVVIPSFDLAEKNLHIEKILLDGCGLDIRRDHSGVSNLQQIVRETSSKSIRVEKTPAPEEQPGTPEGPPPPPADSPPFRMNADAVEIKGMSVAFEDAGATTPVKGGCSRIDLNFKASLGPGAEGTEGAVTGEGAAAGDGTTEAKSSPSELKLEGLALSLGDIFLKLANTEKAILELKKIELDVHHVDLAKRSVQLTKLLVDGGALDVDIDSSGVMNLDRLARELSRQKPGDRQETQPETSPEEPSPESVAPPPDVPFKVNADAIDIQGIAFDFSDASRAQPMKARCSDIAIHLKADLQVGAQGPQGKVFDISSELKEIQLSDTEASDPLFRTGKLTVEGGECDLAGHSVLVPRIALSEGHVDVSRDAEGRINWTQLFAPHEAAEPSPASPPPSGSQPSWSVMIKSLELEGFGSRLSDLSASPDKSLFDVQGLKARLSDLDGKSPLGFEVSFQVEQGGNVNLSGKVAPAVPSVEAQIKVADFSLTPLQPYLDPFVTLLLKSGAVSTQGKLTFAAPGGGANLVYDGSFSLNKLNLTEPASDHTYLGLKGMQVPKMKLTLQPNRFDTEEVRLSGLVGEMIIAEDKSINLTKVVKNQQGREKAPAAPEPKTKEEKEGFPFRIGKVKVDEGNVFFADYSLTPKFNARIHDLKGFINGLSSSKDARAKIQLDGRVDQYGVAKINGGLQLYEFQRSTEIDMSFRNVEMTSLSPYSGKFAGRQIKSGKLSADFKYRIENRKLVGDNKIIVDNFVLGEHVDSPDAVNLPLDLAVALLKDSEGRINLGLPVTGDLDNPEFSIGPLIWKAFVSLLTRTVTAPFRALGSLFGGKDEEFKGVEFEAGSAELPPPEREKLQKLAGALQKRPELKLILQGRYNPEADGSQLKDLSVRRTVATRLGVQLKPEEDPGPIDLGDSAVREQLEGLFEERFGKEALRKLDGDIASGAVKPRAPEVSQPEESKRKKKGFFSSMANNLKLYKLVPGGKSPEQAVLWSGELYVRLVESEPLAEEVLIKLAENRARIAAEELEQAGKVPADRLTLEKPEPVTDETGPALKVSLGAR